LAVDEFFKQLARRHPDALAGWLQGLLGRAPHPVPAAGPWQLLDRELPAASQQADTVILSCWSTGSGCTASTAGRSSRWCFT
jgi:hypothetical protein